jgi:branched-chain amino acid transport system substrate-binding protein
MKLHWMAFGAALAGLWSAPALAADSGPVKIALIADKTGPLEAYAKQTSAGFAMGLAMRPAAPWRSPAASWW